MGLTLKHFKEAVVAMGVNIDDDEFTEGDEDMPPKHYDMHYDMQQALQHPVGRTSDTHSTW